jgi:hypothetical protein
VKKGLILTIILLVYFLFPKQSFAAFTSVSDTLSTSRPSAATVLTTNQPAAQNYVIVDNSKGNLFLASDSAVIKQDAGSYKDYATVASSSGYTANQKVIYFSRNLTFAHYSQVATAIVPITARHIISFRTGDGMHSGAHIVITFPTLASTDSDSSSPSASGFMFNNLQSSDITWTAQAAGGGANPMGCNAGGTTISGTSAGSTPTLDCQIPADLAVNTTLTATIAGKLINPTNAITDASCEGAQTCTADTWKITIKDDTETSVALAGTVEPVTVQAIVAPSMTFTISGEGPSVNYNTIGGANCGSETASNGSISTLASSVNLGYLSSAAINHAAQLITVTSNSPTGYSITATSSGQFSNAALNTAIPDANSGVGLNDNDKPAPALITSGTAAFGISPCGTDTSTATWGNGTIGTSGTSTAKFSNPWNRPGNGPYYATISSYSGGSMSSGRTTVIRYGAAISTTTSPGNYQNYFTYVATPIF